MTANHYTRTVFSPSSLRVLAASLGLSMMPLAVPALRSDFVLSSVDPRLQASVPEKYTARAFGCIGGNLSPALRWSGAPPGTKSFVVTLFDRSVRSR